MFSWSRGGREHRGYAALASGSSPAAAEDERCASSWAPHRAGTPWGTRTTLPTPHCLPALQDHRPHSTQGLLLAWLLLLPLGRTIWGARSPACPALLPVPKAPQSLPPGTRGLGSRKPPARGTAVCRGAALSQPGPASSPQVPPQGFPRSHPAFVPPPGIPPHPRGERGVSAHPSQAQQPPPRFPFGISPFRSPSPATRHPDPHPHLQPPHDPRAHSERNPSDGKGGRGRGGGLAAPCPPLPTCGLRRGSEPRTAPHHPAEGCAAPRSPAASPGGGPRGTHPSPGRQGRGAPGPGGSVPVRARRG